MFHRAILITVICMLSAMQARGATVYTASGETYKGKVTKHRGSVIVETAKGRVVLNAKIVIHIEGTEPVEPEPKTVNRPTTTRPGPTTQPGDIVLPSMLLKSGAMVLGNATRPEPIIYMYMRALSVAQGGPESTRLRRQIDLWRAHAHDRLRKAGKQWLAPKDFVRHRKAFVQQLAEADKLRSMAGRTRRYSSYKPPPPMTAKQKRYKYEALDKMFQAGRSWADPPMQNFLVGIAQMQAHKFDRAEAAFKLGVKQAPLLAGLHQGLGLAFAKQHKYLSALEAFLETLRLKPDSGEALYLVRETMKQVPGRSIKSALYRRAVETITPYTTPPRTKSTSYRARSVEWLMPETKTKSWRVSETTMPTPPYDRLEFRQAVGVAVAEHTLLVDARVSTGALAVFVRIDDVFVPAKIGRASYSSTKARPPVATVYLTDYALTPVNIPTAEAPAKTGPCTIYSMGIFGQMKQTIRESSGEFTPGGEKKPGSVSRKLLPGEGTSPVLSKDGKLVGFLAGKTTVALDGAGADKFISLSDISSIVKRAASSRINPIRSTYSSAAREITPKPLKGKTFVVYAIYGELFKSGV
ncbi:MAG: hypothetical protein QGG42_01655 [Phycisphaerae bacterium]|jgi:hypothetical protein|nr:hypothetical protein [Phycisphaerae bacterium]